MVQPLIDKATFKRLLLEWRKREKLTQFVAAEKLDVPYTTFIGWEFYGKVPPRLTLKIVLKEILPEGHTFEIKPLSYLKEAAEKNTATA